MMEVLWKDFCIEKNFDLPVPDAWMFGDGTKDMGDYLGSLVLEGKKTGTCSAYILYNIKHETLPQIGQYDIILDGSKNPIAIIRNKHLELIKMDDVTEDFAKKEGEGDLSYEYWYNEHQKFFTNEFDTYHLKFSTEELLICEEFEVICHL